MLHKITVEPILCLYILSYMIINIIEKDYYLHVIEKKFIYDNINYPSNFSIFYPILYKEQILNEISIFLKYNYIAEYIILLLCFPFYVLVNRIFGSKLMIVISLFGKIVYASGMIICTYIDISNIYIILSVTIISSLFGSNVLIFANCFNIYVNKNKKTINIPLEEVNKNISSLDQIVPLIRINTLDNLSNTEEQKPKDSVIYKNKRYSYNELTKRMNTNLLETLKIIVDFIEFNAKNFELLLNKYEIEAMYSINLKENINIINNNLIIICKILKKILIIIDNNESLNNYPEIIEYMNNIGCIDENKYTIITDDIKYLDKIIIKPKIVLYNTINYEGIKNFRTTDMVKKNIVIIYNQLVGLRKDILKKYDKDETYLSRAQYICRYIRNFENILKHTLLCINYDNNHSLFKNIKLNSIPENNIYVPKPEELLKEEQNIIINESIDFSILHFSYLICIPIGTFLGKILYSYLKNYMYMYTVTFIILYFTIIYTWMRFKREIIHDKKFFDFNYLKNIATFNYKNQKQIIIVCIIIFLYMIEREENTVLYLYTRFMFNWDFSTYSIFKTIHVGFSSIVLLITYVYNIYFNINIKKNILLGSVFCIIGQIIYLCASVNENIFRIGLLFSPLNILIMNNIKTYIPKITSDDERLNLFIICGVLEQCGSLFFEIILQSAFIAYKQSIFYISIINHIIIFTLVLTFLTKNKYCK